MRKINLRKVLARPAVHQDQPVSSILGKRTFIEETGPLPNAKRALVTTTNTVQPHCQGKGKRNGRLTKQKPRRQQKRPNVVFPAMSFTWTAYPETSQLPINSSLVSNSSEPLTFNSYSMKIQADESNSSLSDDECSLISQGNDLKLNVKPVVTPIVFDLPAVHPLPTTDELLVAIPKTPSIDPDLAERYRQQFLQDSKIIEEAQAHLRSVASETQSTKPRGPGRPRTSVRVNSTPFIKQSSPEHGTRQLDIANESIKGLMKHARDLQAKLAQSESRAEVLASQLVDVERLAETARVRASRSFDSETRAMQALEHIEREMRETEGNRSDGVKSLSRITHENTKLHRENQVLHNEVDELKMQLDVQQRTLKNYQINADKALVNVQRELKDSKQTQLILETKLDDRVKEIGILERKLARALCARIRDSHQRPSLSRQVDTVVHTVSSMPDSTGPESDDTSQLETPSQVPLLLIETLQSDLDSSVKTIAHLEQANLEYTRVIKNLSTEREELAECLAQARVMIEQYEDERSLMVINLSTDSKPVPKLEPNSLATELVTLDHLKSRMDLDLDPQMNATLASPLQLPLVVDDNQMNSDIHPQINEQTQSDTHFIKQELQVFESFQTLSSYPRYKKLDSTLPFYMYPALWSKHARSRSLPLLQFSPDHIILPSVDCKSNNICQEPNNFTQDICKHQRQQYYVDSTASNVIQKSHTISPNIDLSAKALNVDLPVTSPFKLTDIFDALEISSTSEQIQKLDLANTTNTIGKDTMLIDSKTNPSLPLINTQKGLVSDDSGACLPLFETLVATKSEIVVAPVGSEIEQQQCPKLLPLMNGIHIPSPLSPVSNKSGSGSPENIDTESTKKRNVDSVSDTHTNSVSKRVLIVEKSPAIPAPRARMLPKHRHNKSPNLVTQPNNSKSGVATRTLTGLNNKLMYPPFTFPVSLLSASHPSAGIIPRMSSVVEQAESVLPGHPGAAQLPRLFLGSWMLKWDRRMRFAHPRFIWINHTDLREGVTILWAKNNPFVPGDRPPLVGNPDNGGWWGAPGLDGQELHQQTVNYDQRLAKVQQVVKSLLVTHVTECYRGRGNPVLPKGLDDVMFQKTRKNTVTTFLVIQAGMRRLDLQAPQPEEHTAWLQGLEYLLHAQHTISQTPTSAPVFRRQSIPEVSKSSSAALTSQLNRSRSTVTSRHSSTRVGSDIGPPDRINGRSSSVVKHFGGPSNLNIDSKADVNGQPTPVVYKWLQRRQSKGPNQIQPTSTTLLSTTPMFKDDKKGSYFNCEDANLLPVCTHDEKDEINVAHLLQINANTSSLSCLTKDQDSINSNSSAHSKDKLTNKSGNARKKASMYFTHAHAKFFKSEGSHNGQRSSGTAITTQSTSSHG